MTDEVPLRDYSRSRAILVGTWEYEFFQTITIPAVRNSFTRMAELLKSSLCGWPDDRLSLFPNERSSSNLPDRLISIFEDASDVALFYFVGHGLLDDQDELCLTLCDSRGEMSRRATTSLPFHAVRRALIHSPAQIKIVILDCCFSGAATTPGNSLAASLAAAEALDMAVGTGAFTITASREYGLAWYEPPESATPQTFMTKYLIDLIEAGIPGEPEVLKLRPLSRQLMENLARDLLPGPGVRNIDDARDFVFARNTAPYEPPEDIAEELRQLNQRIVDSEAREAALQYESMRRAQKLKKARKKLRNAEEEAAQRLNSLQMELQAARREAGQLRAQLQPIKTSEQFSARDMELPAARREAGQLTAQLQPIKTTEQSNAWDTARSSRNSARMSKPSHARIASQAEASSSARSHRGPVLAAVLSLALAIAVTVILIMVL